MKILYIDHSSYRYPDGMSCIEDFIGYANRHYHSFIELTLFDESNCVFPYLIEEETKQVFINIATMETITEEDVTVLSRSDYDARLAQVVREKCVDCVNYEEDLKGDNLKGHRERLSLDGECWGYEKKSD